MNTIREDIEDLIESGRRKTAEEFDSMLDKYFQDKTEKDKHEIGEALSDFLSVRISQFTEVENKIAQFKQSKRMKKNISVPEMAC